MCLWILGETPDSPHSTPGQLNNAQGEPVRSPETVRGESIQNWFCIIINMLRLHTANVLQVLPEIASSTAHTPLPRVIKSCIVVEMRGCVFVLLHKSIL